MAGYGEVRSGNSALLVVDMQNAYCHPEGAIAKSGGDISAMRAIVPTVRRVIAACRTFGVPVFWTRMEQYAVDARLRSRTVPAHYVATRAEPLCLRGSSDAEMIEELATEIKAADAVIVKHEYSAFYETGLEVLLRIHGVRHLLIVGVATNVCVESTVRDAYFRGFEVLLVEDAVACATAFRDLHEATLKNTRLWFGSTLMAADLDALLGPTDRSVAGAGRASVVGV